MGTSRGNRHGTEHTGIHWIQTFLVIFLRGEGGPGTGDKGPRTAGTSRGKRHDIEYIRLHWIQTFRVAFFRGGQGAGDQEKDTTFYDLLLSTLWGQGGQDLDALENQ